MSTGLLIAIVDAVILLALLLIVPAVRSYRAKQAAKRERLARQAADHRAQADAGVARARDLGSEVEVHQEEAKRHRELSEAHALQAEEHEQSASEAQAAVNRAGAAAGRHDAQAADLESELPESDTEARP